MHRIYFHSSKPRFVNEKEVIEDFKKLALRVAQKKPRVEEIYLFGSYTDGNAAFRSDVDILVILSSDSRKPMDRLDEFLLDFSEGPIPADVIVKTRAEIDRAVSEGDAFYARALKGLRL